MILLAGAVVGRVVPALAGAAALTGVYLLVHLVAPTAMGGGDVKLAIGLGGLAGCFGVERVVLWRRWPRRCSPRWSVWRCPARRRPVPHGPSMCLATAAAAALALLS